MWTHLTSQSSEVSNNPYEGLLAIRIHFFGVKSSHQFILKPFCSSKITPCVAGWRITDPHGFYERHPLRDSKMQMKKATRDGHF